ncbi:MAG: hypothetical protein RLZ44_100 [Pseudomonadota bacterium]
MSQCQRRAMLMPTQHDRQRLQDEIAYMEARLAAMGHDGDCAYENAMVRFYRQEVAARRERLLGA